MAVDTDVSELPFINVVADVEIDCAMKLFDKAHVYVYYGNIEILAVQDTDYVVTLQPEDYDAFSITPTTSLLAKIAALIASSEIPETNRILVRRTLPYTSDFLETDGFLRSRIAREFDRIIMMIQSINHVAITFFSRAVQVPFPEEGVSLPTIASRAGNILAFDADGLPVAYAPGVGGGAVNTTLPVTDNAIVAFDTTTGNLIKKSHPATSFLAGRVRSITEAGTVTISALNDDIVYVGKDAPAATSVIFPSVADRIAAGGGWIGLKNSMPNAALYPLQPVLSGADTMDDTDTPLPQDSNRIKWYKPIADTNDWEIQNG